MWECGHFWYIDLKHVLLNGLEVPQAERPRSAQPAAGPEADADNAQVSRATLHSFQGLESISHV